MGFRILLLQALFEFELRDGNDSCCSLCIIVMRHPADGLVTITALLIDGMQSEGGATRAVRVFGTGDLHFPLACRTLEERHPA